MSMREEMPLTAAFVDELRAAFGFHVVNAWMRGQDGGSFCSRENGKRWCTPGRTCNKCQAETRGRWE